MLIASIPLLAKIFNYKEALQDINIEEYLKNPLTCDCSHSPFQYNPSGHVITGDLNIIQHENPRKNWFKKTKRRHVTYNTRQSVLRRKRIYASFVKSKIPKIFEVVYR
jgi:hypothetical protein